MSSAEVLKKGRWRGEKKEDGEEIERASGWGKKGRNEEIRNREVRNSSKNSQSAIPLLLAIVT